MSKKPCLVLSVILTATMLLTACAPAATPAAAPAAALAAPVQPTIAPTAITLAPTTAAVQPDGPSIKVGLVTDTGGVNDKAFNQLAWEGLQKASKQPTDYEKNIDAFATEGYNVIITVGSLMGDATALKAKQYPNIKREQNRTSSNAGFCCRFAFH